MIIDFYKKKKLHDFLLEKFQLYKKKFIEQKVLRIDQRKGVNFFRIFWTIFEFVKKYPNSNIQTWPKTF